MHARLMPQVARKLLPAVALVIVSACTPTPAEHKAEFFVFGTLVEVSLWDVDDATAKAAFGRLQQEFQRMHREWHAWEPGALTRINAAFAAGETAQGTPDISEMTRRAQEIEARSGGRFNPAVGALVELWGFHTSEFPVRGPPPEAADIDALVQRHPSSMDIRIDGLQMSSDNPAVQLDFGGIAKGYAVDLACAMLREMGVNNAVVNAGGDLRTLGRHGDRPWRIAVRDPAGGVIGGVDAAPDEAIFTSGNYERYREDAQGRYPHILDPRTGRPVRGVASATVIADEGLLADAAATALIVAGPEQWPGVARALGLDKVLLITDSGEVLVSAAMNARMDWAEGVERSVQSL